MRRLARRWLTRPGRTPRRLRLAGAMLCAPAALVLFSASQSTGASAGGGGVGGGATGGVGGRAQSSNPPSKSPVAPAPGEDTVPTRSSPALVTEGHALYEESCSSCHGIALQGRHGIAPSLVSVGAGPVDFYLSTGRMPLENPRLQPVRSPPRFSHAQIEALIAFVSSHGGPPAPTAIPSRGDLALGLHDFTLDCAGCHQIVARGGLTIGAFVPDLQSAGARQIAEAVRMGPYLMPHFDSHQLDQHALDSIARYVLWTRAPSNRGGWGIYNLGPIPEGIVAWFLALASMVLFARLIGERMA